MSHFELGYQKSPLGNVGDDVNPWLMQRLLPDISFGKADRVLLSIGSILVADRWDDYAQKLVMGSGAKSLARLPRIDESWDVRFVRGPLSAKALGETESISDPALLISLYVPPSRHRGGIGIVPYYRSDHMLWRAVAWEVGARLISPRMAPEPFFEALNHCDMVFCEAMHGAIFADALRIPWLPLSFQNALYEGDTHRFKWSDWAGSVELDFDPLGLPVDGMPDQRSRGVAAKLRRGLDGLRRRHEVAKVLRQAISDGAFVRSSDAVFEDRVTRLSAAFEQINREFR